MARLAYSSTISEFVRRACRHAQSSIKEGSGSTRRTVSNSGSIGASGAKTVASLAVVSSSAEVIVTRAGRSTVVGGDSNQRPAKHAHVAFRRIVDDAAGQACRGTGVASLSNRVG